MEVHLNQLICWGACPPNSFLLIYFIGSPSYLLYVTRIYSSFTMKGEKKMKKNRETVVTINFNSNEVTLRNSKTADKIPHESRDSMMSTVWRCVNSPRVSNIDVITSYYCEDIKSIMKACYKVGVEVSVLVIERINNHIITTRCTTVNELMSWYITKEQSEEEWDISVECMQFISKYTKELKPIAERDNAELIETLRSYIYSSGYDVDMQSIFNQDGLNSGVFEDAKGKHEWSRNYTKRYERYNTQLMDLLLMYVSCKYYTQHGFEEPNHYGISESDIDSYTGEVITDPIQIRVHDEDVVVPQSACSLGLQNYMS